MFNLKQPDPDKRPKLVGHFTADQGVSTDKDGNVAAWENQAAPKGMMTPGERALAKFLSSDWAYMGSWPITSTLYGQGVNGYWRQGPNGEIALTIEPVPNPNNLCYEQLGYNTLSIKDVGILSAWFYKECIPKYSAEAE